MCARCACSQARMQSCFSTCTRESQTKRKRSMTRPWTAVLDIRIRPCCNPRSCRARSLVASASHHGKQRNVDCHTFVISVIIRSYQRMTDRAKNTKQANQSLSKPASLSSHTAKLALHFRSFNHISHRDGRTFLLTIVERKREEEKYDCKINPELTVQSAD